MKYLNVFGNGRTNVECRYSNLLIIDEQRVIMFLAGLSIDYDPIKVQLIGKTSCPTQLEVHARIQHEECCLHVMLPTVSTSEKSALVANTPLLSNMTDAKVVNFAKKSCQM